MPPRVEHSDRGVSSFMPTSSSGLALFSESARSRRDSKGDCNLVSGMSLDVWLGFFGSTSYLLAPPTLKENKSSRVSLLKLNLQMRNLVVEDGVRYMWESDKEGWLRVMGRGRGVVISGNRIWVQIFKQESKVRIGFMWGKI